GGVEDHLAAGHAMGAYRPAAEYTAIFQCQYSCNTQCRLPMMRISQAKKSGMKRLFHSAFDDSVMCSDINILRPHCNGNRLGVSTRPAPQNQLNRLSTEQNII